MGGSLFHLRNSAGQGLKLERKKIIDWVRTQSEHYYKCGR